MKWDRSGRRRNHLLDATKIQCCGSTTTKMNRQVCFSYCICHFLAHAYSIAALQIRKKMVFLKQKLKLESIDLFVRSRC